MISRTVPKRVSSETAGIPTKTRGSGVSKVCRKMKTAFETLKGPRLSARPAYQVFHDNTPNSQMSLSIASQQESRWSREFGQAQQW